MPYENIKTQTSQNIHTYTHSEAEIDTEITGARCEDKNEEHTNVNPNNLL